MSTKDGSAVSRQSGTISGIQYDERKNEGLGGVDDAVWVHGDVRLAHKVWFKRRRGWFLAGFLTFSIDVALTGLFVTLFHLEDTTVGEVLFHGDGLGPMIDNVLIALITWVIPLSVSIIYLWHRLKGRPANLVAVRALWDGVKLIAKPDGRDSDGDEVTFDITTILFVADEFGEYIFYVPAMYGDHLLRCLFRVRGASIRLEGFRELTVEQKNAYLNDPEYTHGPRLLDEHSTYDEQTRALLVQSQSSAD